MPTTTNTKSIWDTLWHNETQDEFGNPKNTWRVYTAQFSRIRWLLKNATTETQPGQKPVIVDLGCGAGVLLSQVREDLLDRCPDAVYRGTDISDAAIKVAGAREGITAYTSDIEDEPESNLPDGNILLCTEFLEHMTDATVTKVLRCSQRFAKSFFMVPNNCLGPEDESQHLRKWTAKEFLDLLRQYHPHARVEVFHNPEIAKRPPFYHKGYLLGICGYPKPFKLSFTMPVKNEEQDVERVLASFRGAADELVIGIDDTTTDRTEEIVRAYADTVFKFTWTKDFSAARNACIDQCTGDWVFMSEGHEHLYRGLQVLLQLDEVPEFVNVLDVRREAKTNIWYFPWLFRRVLGQDGRSRIRFANAVHNVLTGYDADKESASAHQISTWHERSLEKSFERTRQRQGMNKQEFLRRIRTQHNVRDMYYLGVEYRDERCRDCDGMRTVAANGKGQVPCPACAVPGPEGRVSTGIKPFAWRQSIYWFEAFLKASKPCPLRYQGRLSLARMYCAMKRWSDAKRTLVEATIDDASRIEHWFMLGEICEGQGQWDLAMRFYEYASLGIGRPPTSAMFLDKAMYTYLPAQKLVTVYSQLELYEEALVWANKVSDLLPEWAPPEAHTECSTVIRSLEQYLSEKQQQRPGPVAPA